MTTASQCIYPISNQLKSASRETGDQRWDGLGERQDSTGVHLTQVDGKLTFITGPLKALELETKETIKLQGAILPELQTLNKHGDEGPPGSNSF